MFALDDGIVLLSLKSNAPMNPVVNLATEKLISRSLTHFPMFAVHSISAKSLKRTLTVNVFTPFQSLQRCYARLRRGR